MSSSNRSVIAASFALLAVLVTASPTQPKDGDVILSCLHSTAWAQGAVVYFDPSRPSLTTLSANVAANAFSECLQMGADNESVVAFEVHQTFFQGGWLVRIDRNGVGTTLAAAPLAVNGLDLDGDGQWVLSGPALGATGNTLYGVDDASGVLRTFVSVTPEGPAAFAGVAIHRERFPYATVAINFQPVASLKVAGWSRQAIQTRLLVGSTEPLQFLSGVDLDPVTGDLITTDFKGRFSNPPEPNGGTEVSRVDVTTGRVSTIVGFSGANAVKVAADGTAFVAGHVLRSTYRDNAVLHVDLGTGAVKSIYTFPGFPSPPWGFSGVDVYGSRVLTCNGVGGPGARIAVALKSHRAGTAGAAYQLAASLGRRPGLRWPNGEYLNLDVTDPLFVASASNALPTVLRGFAGRLDASGRASASIDLPSTWPAALGLTVFVAGVVYDTQGVVQVTNTHWFEL